MHPVIHNSTAESSKFSALKVHCDFLVNDEAGQALGAEALIPMVATRSVIEPRRLHIVAIGDDKQLAAMSIMANLTRNINAKLHFDYDQQVVSQFERLYRCDRCALSMLTAQYRMHPCISLIHSEPFYGTGSITNPLPASAFTTNYNSVIRTGKGFARPSLSSTLADAATVKNMIMEMGNFRTSWRPTRWRLLSIHY